LIFFSDKPEGNPTASSGNTNTFNVSRPVVLTCDTTSLTDQGNPQPTKYEWMKGTRMVANTKVYTFTASSVTESGGYICRTGNAHGWSSDSQPASINIEGK
jgi:hypothetical protein